MIEGKLLKFDHSPLKQKEGQILLFGLLLLGVYFILLLLCGIFYADYFEELLSITITNVIFGRMAGLSIGVASQMDTTFLVFFNFFIESIMVLIFYPLFIFSWNKLEFVSYPPLNRYLERSRHNANKYQPLIQRYGVIGLILFVLTPFAMTGPVVGSFVGFLIGLRHRMTLAVVLSSTFIAIILWTYLIKNFEEQLVAYNDILMMVISIAIAAVLLWYFIKRTFR
jgi:uncharacterized membrane protein